MSWLIVKMDERFAFYHYGEVTILSRKEQILQNRLLNLDDFMKDLEKKKEVSFYTTVNEQIQGISQANYILVNKKEETLQEITQVVLKLEGDQ